MEFEIAFRTRQYFPPFIGDHVRVDGVEYVIVQYSHAPGPEYGDYKLTLALPSQCGYSTGRLAINFDAPLVHLHVQRIDPRLFQAQRVDETATGAIFRREEQAARIRAEVEAMDWPGVISVPWLPE